MRDEGVKGELKGQPKFKIEVQILDEWRRMFLGDWNPLGA